MGLVMEKLPLTVLAAVSLTILVMNLDKILRWIFGSVFFALFYLDVNELHPGKHRKTMLL